MRAILLGSVLGAVLVAEPSSQASTITDFDGPGISGSHRSAQFDWFSSRSEDARGDDAADDELTSRDFGKRHNKWTASGVPQNRTAGSTWLALFERNREGEDGHSGDEHRFERESHDVDDDDDDHGIPEPGPVGQVPLPSALWLLLGGVGMILRLSGLRAPSSRA